MIFAEAMFFHILLCQAAHTASVTNAAKQVTLQSNKPQSASSKCHNVHFNNYQYYSEPRKEIRAHFLKIESQLADVQKKIDALTALVLNTSLSPAGHNTTQVTTLNGTKKPKLGENCIINTLFN